MKQQYPIRVLTARYCLWLVLISFVNVIIDSTDGSRTNLSTNEIESIHEWVTEELIGWDDYVPEQEDDDQHEQSGKTVTDWEAITFRATLTSFPGLSSSWPLNPSGRYYWLDPDIHTPPPERLG